MRGFFLGIGNTRSTIRHLAVTLSFAAGSIAITAVAWLTYMSVQGIADDAAGIEWASVGALVFSYATLSGLLVDSIRWVSARLWRDDPLIRRQSQHNFDHRLA